MADGLNIPRSLRVGEIMRDYQDNERSIAAMAVPMNPDTQNEAGFEAGFVVLRQCLAEAIALFSVPLSEEFLGQPSGPDETQKLQYQRLILEASALRLQSQRILMRASAAQKYIALRGQFFHEGHRPSEEGLQRAEGMFRAELAQVTDQRIFTEMHDRDQLAGCWVQEDPSLQEILNWISSNTHGSSSRS